MKRREKLKRGGIRFSKFTIVGLINAAVDVGTLNLLLWIEPTRIPWQIALYNGVALVLANVNSYVWNSRWTFKGRSEHGLWQGVTFAGQALVNIGISSGLFWLLVRPILLHTEIPTYLAGNAAKAVSVAAASVVSYFLMRYIVFSRRRTIRQRL